MNKNSKILIGVVILVILLGVGYYFMQKQYQPSASTTVNQNSTQNPTVTAVNTVIIQNFTFSPNVLTIKTGTTVTWTNQDSATHKIKSDSFNSPNLNQGDSYMFTFNTKGNFDYSCAIHPSMTGKIIVE